MTNLAKCDPYVPDLPVSADVPLACTFCGTRQPDEGGTEHHPECPWQAARLRMDAIPHVIRLVRQAMDDITHLASWVGADGQIHYEPEGSDALDNLEQALVMLGDE